MLVDEVDQNLCTYPAIHQTWTKLGESGRSIKFTYRDEERKQTVDAEIAVTRLTRVLRRASTSPLIRSETQFWDGVEEFVSVGFTRYAREKLRRSLKRIPVEILRVFLLIVHRP